MVGWAVHSDQYLTLALFFASGAIMFLVWWSQTRETLLTKSQHVAAASFALCVGIAVWINGTWIMLLLGLEPHTDAFYSGEMQRNWALGPIDLMLAVGYYWWLINLREKNKRTTS